jgi:tetratricopeptide (TPR) repeat protein
MNLLRKLIGAGFILFALSALLSVTSTAEMLAVSHADEAIRQLNQQVNSNPRNAAAYSLLCRVYFLLDDWDNAIANGERAVQLDPEVGSYHLWLGRAYGRKAETVTLVTAFLLARKVAKEFERANELDPDDWTARRDLADFYVQAPLVVGGGEYKAERLANRTQSGGAAGPWLELARFYRGRTRWNEFDDAVQHALSSPKKTSEDVFDTGELLVTAGRMLLEASEELRLYLKGNTVDEHASAFRAHYLLGQILEQLGDRQGAIGEYRFSLALASGYHPAKDALRRLGA